MVPWRERVRHRVVSLARAESRPRRAAPGGWENRVGRVRAASGGAWIGGKSDVAAREGWARETEVARSLGCSHESLQRSSCRGKLWVQYTVLCLIIVI